MRVTCQPRLILGLIAVTLGAIAPVRLLAQTRTKRDEFLAQRVARLTEDERRVIAEQDPRLAESLSEWTDPALDPDPRRSAGPFYPWQTEGDSDA